MTVTINKVILVGFVGKKPEQYEAADGKFFTTFSLATSKSWKNKSGEPVRVTQWHQICAFGSRSSILCQFLDKGSLCYIEGELRNYTSEDDSSVSRKNTQVILQKFKCLDKLSAKSPAKQQIAIDNHEEDENDRQ